jgi:hypothetical protein
MDSQAPNSNEAGSNAQPAGAGTAWKWRSTGLFYPEIEDWALNRPVPAPEANVGAESVAPLGPNSYSVASTDAMDSRRIETI